VDEQPCNGGDLNWEELRVLLHRLWTRSVGNEGYNKAEWRQLEEAIDQLWFLSRRPTTSTRPRPKAASMPDIVPALSRSEEPPAGYELVTDPDGTPAEPRTFQRIR